MFSKIISIAAIAILAVATPALAQCDTAPVECCDSVESSSSPSVANLLDLLGIVVQGVDVPIGLGCTPVSVVGAGGDSCGATPVCCSDTSHDAVAIGCVPVTAGL